MKSILRLALFLSIPCLILVPIKSHAQSEPQDMVRAMLDEVKSSGDHLAVLNYVDWEEIYTSTPESMKTFNKIDSPEALKLFYSSFLRDPARIAKQMGSFGSLPPTYTKRKDGTSSKIPQKPQETIAKLLREMRDELPFVVFEIGEVAIEKDLAQVNITASSDQGQRQQRLVLSKTGNKWYLKNVQLIQIPGRKTASKRDDHIGEDNLRRFTEPDLVLPY